MRPDRGAVRPGSRHRKAWFGRPQAAAKTSLLFHSQRLLATLCKPTRKRGGRGGGDGMFPKARLDTISDSIFAVAMTILVLDVRLPDNFHPNDNAGTLQGRF